MGRENKQRERGRDKERKIDESQEGKRDRERERKRKRWESESVEERLGEQTRGELFILLPAVRIGQYVPSL